MYEELDANTFGSIVDIKGDVGNILLMLNNPCMKKDLNDGIMNSNSTSTIKTNFKKGCLTVSIESEDSLFCISLPNKVYLNNKTVKIITSPKGAYLSEVVLAFQGIDKFDEVKKIIKDVHGLEVIELVPDVHSYSSFDHMLELFDRKKLQDQSLISL